MIISIARGLDSGHQPSLLGVSHDVSSLQLGRELPKVSNIIIRHRSKNLSEEKEGRIQEPFKATSMFDD